MDKTRKDLVFLNCEKIPKEAPLFVIDANTRLINLYFKIGKMIYENSTWGNKFIETLETELKLDFPNIKGFSARNLKRMKRFYTEYKDYEKVPPAVAQLPWIHNVILFEKIKDMDKRIWYSNEAFKW